MNEDQARVQQPASQVVDPDSMPRIPAPGRSSGVKVLMFLVVIALGVAAWWLTRPAPTTPAPLPPHKVTQETGNIQSSSDANNYFGFNVFGEVSQSMPTSNTLISPLSLSLALTWTSNGAVGPTQAEMKKVLGLSNLDLAAVNQSNASLISSLGKTDTVDIAPANSDGSSSADSAPTFRIANSLWVDKLYSILPSFESLSQTTYQAEAQSLDFQSPASLKTINDWVSQKTNGKIPTILDQLKSQIYLVNALYFKSAWQQAFLAGNTKTEPFHLSDGSAVQAPLMHQTESFAYASVDGTQVVGLPYSGSHYQMVVFLPAKNTTVDQLAASLGFDSYAAAVTKLQSQDVNLTLPKFHTEFGQDVLPLLKTLGLTLSTSDQADFGAMIDTTKGSGQIGEVVHKTFIDADEKGTEAAAATAVGIRLTATMLPTPKPEPIVMTVDRPFFFTIEDSTTHSIIFMGTVKNPSAR